MAAVITPSSPSASILSRGKLCVLVSLIVTWWFAFIHQGRLGNLQGPARCLQPVQSCPLDRTAAVAAPSSANTAHDICGSAGLAISLHRLRAERPECGEGLRFYDEFLPGVEWILKYESDSILCANSQTSLDEWLNFDWVGTPLAWSDTTSGGGGLTLRRVSTIRQVLSFQARYNNTEHEDEWFGKRVNLLPGARVAASRDKALAVEKVYVPDTMGFHIPVNGQHLAHPVWGVRKRRMEIFGYCPEVSMILEMKLERERCPDDTDNGQLDRVAAFDDRRKKFLEKLKQKQDEERARLKAEAESGERATGGVVTPSRDRAD